MSAVSCFTSTKILALLVQSKEVQILTGLVSPLTCFSSGGGECAGQGEAI
jgi:hypothetical protein